MTDEKITIIEGPPPTFELVHENWAHGIVDSPNLANVAVTQLRTFNGPALVERCHKAWHKKDPIKLEFRANDGSTMEAPIVAARTTESDDGHLLFLWVRLPHDGIEIEYEYQAGPEDDIDDWEEDPDDDDLDLEF